MLPSMLKGTYWQYKQDTDSVAGWLASTAKSLGYSAADLQSLVAAASASKAVESGGRLKGKARAQAKKRAAASAATQKQPLVPAAPKYIISVDDFIPLAMYIASKTIPVPRVLKNTIDRVIAARSGFGSKLEKHGHVLDEVSDANHQYFVQVLEKVREILKPFMPTDNEDVPNFAAENLSNRFAGLTVYEPSREFLEMPDVERPANAQNDHAIYEIEPEKSFEEAIFAMTALVNDMNRMKSHINWVWSNYKIGQFDVAAAAITTNTAIDLIRNTMEDVLPLLEQHGGLGRMLHSFYMLQCVMNGWDFDSITAPGKDNFNYATYDIARGTYVIAHRLLAGFAAALQPGRLPLYKEGLFGYYDASSDRSGKTGQQKFEDDRALLMPFFSEQITVARGMSNIWPTKDEFLRGMEQLNENNKEVPFYAVFAAQVFLDITYELGQDVENPFRVLIKHSSIISSDIDSHFKFHSDLKIDTWPASNDAVMRQLQRDIQWIGADPLRAVQVKSYQGTGVVPPTIESHRILRMSPVISGLMLYHFRSRYRELGLAVANAWGSVQYCQHLYNALRRQELLAPRWIDMEVLYTNLGDDSFYVGADTPKSPDEYFKKFCLQMGTSAAAMSNRRRKSTPLASTAGPRGLREASPVLSMFHARYVEDSGQLNLTPEQLKHIMNLSLFEVEESEEDGTFTMGQIEDPDKLKEKKKMQAQHKQQEKQPSRGPRSCKKVTEIGRLAPEHLLKPLVFALHAETLEFSFPYLMMHRWCWKVLRSVKESCDGLLRNLFTAAYIEHERQLPFVVGWVLMAAASKVEGGSANLLPMRKAAEALDVFIRTGAGQFVVTQIMGKQLGLQVEFEHQEDDGSEDDKN